MGTTTYRIETSVILPGDVRAGDEFTTSLERVPEQVAAIIREAEASESRITEIRIFAR